METFSPMVKRWDIITIGNLTRNRYWGESDDRAVRPVLCTCTLISGQGFRLLVDPSISDADRMAAELDRRTGLKREDIDLVFVTHAHGDHHCGVRNFPDATWLAGIDTAQALNRSGQYMKRFEPAPKTICDGIDVVPAPGHSVDHHVLRFKCDGLSIVLAGDAVMTREFWHDRRGFFNSVDLNLASQTIERLTSIADIIVPGHDNYFPVRRG
jgi:glyoxylase-like metal-dependent hydrolase (beta-lactamase superfamily II)